MAYYNEDQLYRYFDKAIEKEAQKKIENLGKEIDYLYAKEMKKIKEELTMKRDLQLNKALRELQLDYQDKVNKIGVGYDAKLIKERTFMTNIIFQSVLDKLYQFLISDDYEQLMHHKLININTYIKSKHVIIKISDHDTHLEKIIKKTITSPFDIIKSEHIHLGGFEVFIKDDGVEIDETIDSKFAEKKEWFFKNSKLFIRR